MKMSKTPMTSKSATTTQVAFRFEDELLKRVDRHAKRTSSNRADAVRDLLTQALNDRQRIRPAHPEENGRQGSNHVWENVAIGVQRMLVPGGWLYRSYCDGEQVTTSTTIENVARASLTSRWLSTYSDDPAAKATMEATSKLGCWGSLTFVPAFR